MITVSHAEEKEEKPFSPDEADLPSQVVRCPFQPERDAIPYSQVHGSEEADEEREIDDRRSKLERVARPAIAERRDDGDCVNDGGVGVYLCDRIAGNDTNKS